MMNGKTKLLFALGLSVTVLGMAAVSQDKDEEQITKAKLGKKAPDFTLVDSTGQERSLSDYEGRIVVLEWFNPRCPYVQNCYKSKSMQEALENAKRLDKSIAWLAINSTHTTSADPNNMWIKRFKLPYPILLDTKGTVGKLYDARRTPHMFVIDKKGVLRYHGAIDNNAMASKPADEVINYTVNAIRQIVEGETISRDHVKPYGCSVKYRP